MKATGLFARRKQAGISQPEYARRLGVYPHTIQNIEHGLIGIDEETYDRMIALLAKMEAERKETVAA